MTGTPATANGMANGGQSLDEIIHQNNLEMMRRRTYQHPQFRNPTPENHVRRSSMLEFGAPISDDLANFQFDPNPTTSMLPTSIGDMTATPKSLDPGKVRSGERLNVNTRFATMESTYNAYQNPSSYSPALMSGVSMNLEPQYMPQNMDLSVDFDNAGGDVTPMNMQSSHNQPPMYTDSPLDHNFPLTYPDASQDPGEVGAGSEEQTLMDNVGHMNVPEPVHSGPVRQEITAPSPVSTSQVQNTAGMSSPAQVGPPEPPQMSPTELQSNASQYTDRITPSLGGRLTCAGEELAKPRPSKFYSKYSSSGFDMLSVLVRATLFLFAKHQPTDSIRRSKSLRGQTQRSISGLSIFHAHSWCATSRSMTCPSCIAPTYSNASPATRDSRFLDGTVGFSNRPMAKCKLASNAST